MGNRLSYIGYSVPDYSLEIHKIRNMRLNDKILNLEKYVNLQNDSYSNRLIKMNQENLEIKHNNENLSEQNEILSQFIQNLTKN